MNYWQKRKNAFRYAFAGVGRLFRDEAHAKIHAIAAMAVIAAGFIFNIERWEWCAAIICIGGVFMAEAVNTALEKVCDKVCVERHPLIGQAKDMAAGAVLLMAICAAAVGLIIFLPYIFSI